MIDDIVRLIFRNNFQFFLTSQVHHVSEPDVYNRPYGRDPLLVSAVTLQFHTPNMSERL